ncbi:hypothetical protein HNV12_02875 [Methanococcoides sp. SA1]|nr:hypothetical protein [Methanococcoides sp. SA1]
MDRKMAGDFYLNGLPCSVYGEDGKAKPRTRVTIRGFDPDAYYKLEVCCATTFDPDNSDRYKGAL